MKTLELMLRNVPLCQPDHSLQQAAQQMLKAGLSSLPVVSTEQGGILTGIITESDLLRCVADGCIPLDVPVERYMQQEVLTSSPEQRLQDLDLSSGPGADTLIVVDAQKHVLGIVPNVRRAVEQARTTAGASVSAARVAVEVIYRCEVCGHTWERDAGLPEKCPSCGADRKQFVLITED